MVVLLLVLIGAPVVGEITPALTEINLGPVPIDKYDNSLNSGADVIPSCPETWTVNICTNSSLAAPLPLVPR